MAQIFLDSLATAATTEIAAHNLLDAAGLDVALVQRWDLNHSPRVNWTAILEEVQSVTGEDGIEALRKAAAKRYPAAFAEDSETTLRTRLDTLYEDREDAEGDHRKALDAEILDIRRRLRDRVLQPNEWLGDGRFKLKRLLGSGGFGEVWLAYDRKERRKVALKILHSQYARDATRRERFLRGARQMAKLDHPGIVRVLGESHDGEDCFFAMEYVPGGDLRQAVCQKKITTDEALERVLEVGDALANAHERGVVHRDVKPANILLTEDGRAKLTDFDLVRAADTTGGTRTQALGSFIYAAPEMMEAAKEAAEPADVYGLAMTTCFVIHGAELPSRALWATEAFLKALEVRGDARQVLMGGLEKEASARTGGVTTFCKTLTLQLQPTTNEAWHPADLPADLEELFSWIETPRDGRVPVWREIPAGTFLMGSPTDEEGRYDGEVQHEVTISQPFQIMTIPVTNAMYQAFDPEFKPLPWKGIGTADLAFHPAVQVSWRGAERFVSWLAERLSGVRLPTEAEWEYACRACTWTRYWSGGGEDDLERVGWYRANAGERTHRVGAKAWNPWGLYDMHGNVWEWCADWYGAYTTEPVVDPIGPEMGEYRVFRGGSWGNAAQYVRAAYRRWYSPSFRGDYLGFRLARS